MSSPTERTSATPGIYFGGDGYQIFWRFGDTIRNSLCQFVLSCREVARVAYGVDLLPIGHRFRTDFSRWSENQGLTRFVSDRERCPNAITNSLCVNRVRVSQLVNTIESMRVVRAGTRCYTQELRSSTGTSVRSRQTRRTTA